MKYAPYKYQAYAEQFILEHDAAGLFLDMGLGKTAISLSACEKLLRDWFAFGKVLIIAPLKPAKETWPVELAKWDNLEGLTYSLILGSEQERIAALNVDADFYIVNRENVVWLVDFYKKRWPFEMVVIDELSSFKSSKAQRFRALKKVRKYIKRIVGLTGTPAPNGLLDLWSQVYLLDQGERFGKTLAAYRETYFNPGRRGPNGVIYDWMTGPQKRAPKRRFMQSWLISVSACAQRAFLRGYLFVVKSSCQIKLWSNIGKWNVIPFSHLRTAT